MTALGYGSDIDMRGHVVTALGSAVSDDEAVNLAQLKEMPFVAPTFGGDINSAPIGWSSFVPEATNAPGVAGSGGYLMMTFRNEDDSARAQLAFSVPGGEISIRFNLGGWGAWVTHVA